MNSTAWREKWDGDDVGKDFVNKGESGDNKGEGGLWRKTLVSYKVPL